MLFACAGRRTECDNSPTLIGRQRSIETRMIPAIRIEEAQGWIALTTRRVTGGRAPHKGLIREARGLARAA